MSRYKIVELQRTRICCADIGHRESTSRVSVVKRHTVTTTHGCLIVFFDVFRVLFYIESAVDAK